MRPLPLLLALLLVPAAAAQETAVYERGPAARYEAGATGTPTASGEPYNPERMTLAHPTLPFGTLVQVVNRASGASITARVNDRVPEGGRVRLSARTADHLGLPARGGEVELRLDATELAYLRSRMGREEAKRPAPAPAPTAPAAAYERYTVQVASFSEEGRAVAAAGQIRGAWVLPVSVDGRTVYRVCYGVFDSAEAAAEGQARLREQGAEGFVKGLDAAPAASERSEETPVQPTTSRAW